jgi:methylmalonyl-CoA mutase N-terminal domain/subunit
VETRFWEYLDKIESMGGAVKAIEAGFFQMEIATSSYEYQRKIESREKIVVGVNEFNDADNIQPRIFELDPMVRETQTERVRKVKSERNPDDVRRSLQELKRRSAGSENLMPSILAAVESYATLGEISGALREIWGTYEAG